MYWKGRVVPQWHRHPSWVFGPWCAGGTLGWGGVHNTQYSRRLRSMSATAIAIHATKAQPHAISNSQRSVTVCQGNLTSKIQLSTGYKFMNGSIPTPANGASILGNDKSGHNNWAANNAEHSKTIASFCAPRIFHRRLLRASDNFIFASSHVQLHRPFSRILNNKGWLLDRIRNSTNRLAEAFLPADYKRSVTPEYIDHAKWQFVHNMLGAASGVLSTQAMLYAVGLGAGAIPLSAAINWVIKDGFGQLGGVVYATLVGQKFDSDPKHLRFWSTVWLQAATWLEMLTALVPHMFLVVGSIANIGKNISWLAISATKASINMSFCRKENIGDITAKSGSQATAAGLIGTAAGVIVGASISGSIYMLLAAFIPLSLTSIWANYKSLSYVITPTLNLERAHLMMDKAINIDDGMLRLKSGTIMTPRQVSEIEQVMNEVHSIPLSASLPGISILPQLDKIRKRKMFTRETAEARSDVDLAYALSYAFEQRNLIVPEKYYIGYIPGNAQAGYFAGNVCLWFDTNASDSDITRGFYHAMAYRKLLGSVGSTSATWLASDQEQAAANSARISHEFVQQSFDVFCTRAKEIGWDLDSIYLAKRSTFVDVKCES